MSDADSGVLEMLEHLQAWTTETGRDDLGDAGRWLIEHSVNAGDDVICRGDLHPFNVLIEGQGHVTVLDWSTSVLAPRALDVAFTSMLLSSPPVVPAPARPALRAAGRGLARRFRNRYRHYSGDTIDASCLAWFQALVCLRALAEAASWKYEGVIDTRAGHPWLLLGPPFAAHLSAVTGVPVRPL